MIAYSQPIVEIIRRRFSCRSYASAPISVERRRRLAGAAESLRAGPLGTPLRFTLVAAAEEDSSALKGLGTYGFIRGATGFLVGAVGQAEKNQEDYGYGLEQLVLLATDLELGTCWLGGSFTRSSFAQKIAAQPGEIVPAVISTGLMDDAQAARKGLMRRQVDADRRLPWESLIFDGRFGAPLAPAAAGAWAMPLEMLRLGPSASNKQPWRVVRAGGAWHFFLQRTPSYPGGLGRLVLGITDIQRVDMGIAMCHFALTAGELGLAGRWVVQEPALDRPDGLTEYTASWVS